MIIQQREREREREQIRQLFLNYNIKSVELKKNKETLNVIWDGEENMPSDAEILLINSYLNNHGLNSLSLKDLEQVKINDQQPEKPNYWNYVYVVFFLFAFILLIYSSIKKRKKK